MNRTVMVGGVGSTHEGITTKSTFLGILIPPAIMLFVKGLVLLIFVATTIFIGQIVGPALLAGVALYALTRPYDYQSKEKLWLAFSIGAIVCFFTHVVNAWPLLVMWLWFPDSGTWISWLGKPFVRATPELVLLRWVIGIIIPWMLWWPYKWTMWALMAELLMPKYRESTFTRGDIASMPQPEGMNLRGQQIRAQEVPPNAHIPARAGGGGPEIIGE